MSYSDSTSKVTYFYTMHFRNFDFDKNRPALRDAPFLKNITTRLTILDEVFFKDNFSKIIAQECHFAFQYLRGCNIFLYKIHDIP